MSFLVDACLSDSPPSSRKPAGRPLRLAIRIARSMATQHMSCEYRNFLGPPRVSQMPSSGWSQ